MNKHKLYKLLTKRYQDHVVKNLKHTNKEVSKEFSAASCWQLPRLLARYEDGIKTVFLRTDTDVSIFAAEYTWANAKGDYHRLVVYPDSYRELEIMGKSSFNNIDIADVNPGLFVIASPPDSDLPSLVVGVMCKEDIGRVNAELSKQVPDWEPVSCTNNFFIVLMENQSGEYLILNIADYEFEKFAEAKTIDQVLKLREGQQHITGMGYLSEEDAYLQARCLKIALNTWLYRQASPQSFSPGTPPVHARDNYGSTPSRAIRFSIKPTKPAAGGELVEVGIHMRNLKDERFYRSEEWKDKQRGSRWIEVGAYTRGGNPETFEVEKG